MVKLCFAQYFDVVFAQYFEMFLGQLVWAQVQQAVSRASGWYFEFKASKVIVVVMYTIKIMRCSVYMWSLDRMRATSMC